MSLRSEAQVMERWNGASSSPLVSICCATHNHRNWIDEAIRGFLRQDTTFPFEIVVRDDASCDGTSEIVHEFARQYPNIVRPLINVENRFARGEQAVHVWHTVARGKFIALCEGDDFWISTSKLQKQVELLERYPEAVMSVALSYRQQVGAEARHVLSTLRRDGTTLLGFEDVHSSYYHTSTYVIRSEVLFPVVQRYFAGHALFGDTALRAILVSIGPFVLLPEFVSVYRETGRGVWTSLDRAAKLRWEFDVAKKLAEMLNGKHSKRQRDRLYGISLQILKTHAAEGSLATSLHWLPRVLWYGVCKIPGYVSKRLRSW